MVKQGPLSAADAAYINDQLRQLDVLKRQVQGMLGQAPELIPAAITSMTTVSWSTQTTNSTGTTSTTHTAVQHAWYEQTNSAQGARVTLIGGRTGTNLIDPARMPNGATLASTITSAVPVWIRKAAIAQSHGMIHEIVGIVGATSGGSSSSAAARVYRTANQTIGTTAFVRITFDGEDIDTDNFHDNVTNNSRLTIPETGNYEIGWTFSFEAPGAQYSITSYLALNVDPVFGGGSILSQDVSYADAGSNPVMHNGSTIYPLVIGDWVEMFVTHLKGSNLNLLSDVSTGAYFTPVFWIHRV